MTSSPLDFSDCTSDVTNEDFEIINHSTESLCDVSAENYLTLPEDILMSSSVTELKSAIDACKAMILTLSENEDKRKWLVRRLTELQIRLESLKEMGGENSSDETANEKNKVVLGHHFSLQNFSTSTLQHYCDRCSGIIWNILHSWYLCSDCKYKCHVKCLGIICRVCAHVVVSENPIYISDICPEPENGLAHQNYRCAECLTLTSFCNDMVEPRLCDYNGKYYCSTCHWNSKSVIPARVILNWDFKERVVCRASKQILKLMVKLPILKLEELNPVLFACVEELANVKQLRRQLMQIKKYLTSCKFAVEHQLLWRSGDKHHFLENEDSYSLQDLLELHSGELIKYLNKQKEDFIRHIMIDCQVCKGRGFYCELCEDKNVIFPFEENSVPCGKCQSTFHFSCWIKNNQECPKCNRMQKRLLQNQSDFICKTVDS